MSTNIFNECKELTGNIRCSKLETSGSNVVEVYIDIKRYGLIYTVTDQTQAKLIDVNILFTVIWCQKYDKEPPR